jgi:hypothetical protein
MDCNVFLEAFEKNFDIMLSEEEKQQFCRWVEETAGTGNLNVQSLLKSSPEGLSSKLEDIEKLREQERLAIQDALEILIDVYLGTGLID